MLNLSATLPINHRKSDKPPFPCPSHSRLSPTEIKVLEFVLRGKRDREIASELCIGRRTVESHIAKMLHKTNCRNRTELALWAIENGWGNLPLSTHAEAPSETNFDAPGVDSCDQPEICNELKPPTQQTPIDIYQRTAQKELSDGLSQEQANLENRVQSLEALNQQLFSQLEILNQKLDRLSQSNPGECPNI